MFRLPKYYILIFVGLSVLTAYGIHRARQSSGFFHSSANNQHLNEIQFSSLSPGSNQNLQFEEPSTCGAERLVLEEKLRAISPLFRDERSQTATEFPRECFTFMMKRKFQDLQKRNQDLGACLDSQSKPTRGAAVPCVTKTYVTSIYNFFSDVSDCLETPQRAQLPEIFTLSGGHLNSLGADLEAGLAQLNLTSIAVANLQFVQTKNQILSSEKASCQRLAPRLKNMVALSSQESGRCAFLSVPQNPFVSILYLNIKYLQDRQLIREALQSAEISTRMARLGLAVGDYDAANLEQILITLARSAGAQTSVLALSNYLKRVESNGKKLVLSDFDFGKSQAQDQSVDLLKSESFPGFIQRNLQKKVSDYLHQVRLHADQLNREFKEGVCSPNSFLAL